MNVAMVQKNRWLVVVGAILIQLALGAIYAWSVFTKTLTNPEGAFKFSTKETLGVFAAGLASFAIVMVLAGKLQAKIGPRPVAMLGGFLLGMGYVLASFLGTSFEMQLIFIGIVGGAGIGFAYVCPIAVGMKWFPDKKGLITGLAVAGFGFGSTIWILLAGAGVAPISGANLIAELGILKVFLIYGIVFFVMVELGSLVMINPPAGWKPEGWNPPAPATGGPSAGSLDYQPNEMLKRPQFYGLWICFVFSAFAGLMFIGIVKLFGVDALQVNGMDAQKATGVTELGMGLCFALANGLGRIIWGKMSDSIGRKTSIFIMTAVQGLMMFVIFFFGRSEALFYVFAVIVGFNFGGNFSLFPTATADFFGTKNVGQNYGWMFTAYGLGGILGNYIPAMFRDAATEAAKAAKAAGTTLPPDQAVNAWMWPFIIAGVLCLTAALISLINRPPKKEIQQS
jgi:MFS family permease